MDVVSSFRRRPLVISVLRDAIPIHLEVAHRLLDSARRLRKPVLPRR